MVKLMQAASLKLNNMLCQRIKKSLRGSEMMILLPRCLQNSECTQNIVEDSSNCKQCGRCPVGEVIAISKKYDVPVAVATGGLMAREYVKRYRPRVIIAVACEHELLSGILKVFPRAVYAVTNARPNGPCKNTHIEPRTVEDAILLFRKE